MTDQNMKGKLFLFHNMNKTLQVQRLETFARMLSLVMLDKAEHELNRKLMI